MSTRAIIMYADKKDEIDHEAINLYIHSDGYPEGVKRWLIPFLESEGAQSRINDKSYLFSWLLTHYNINYMLRYCLRFEGKTFAEEMEKRDNYEPKGKDILKARHFAGSGIVEGLGYEEEFIYVISPVFENMVCTGCIVQVFDADFYYIDEWEVKQ